MCANLRIAFPIVHVYRLIMIVVPMVNVLGGDGITVVYAIHHIIIIIIAIAMEAMNVSLPGKGVFGA